MRKKILIVILVVLVFLAGGIMYLKAKFDSGELQQVIAEQVIKKVVSNSAGVKNEEQNALQQVLGFEKPQTYLVLFLNNTELRPGGGFIGAYATVRIDKGTPHILKVEGTEIFDNLAPQDFPSVPPEPIAKYLKVKRWGFRDSNWSPDFAVSSKKTLELYKLQKGVAADEITAVIGITPTVMEEILKITGPITLNGETYTSDNFTKKLEYEVEYGYEDKGQNFNQRKQALQDLTGVMMARLTKDVFTHWGQFLALAQDLLNQKQIIAYSSLPEAQNILISKNWAGTFVSSTSDFLLVADANLGALKTDAVMKRSLDYTIRQVNGHYQAIATMTYTNAGKYDWRTTRYLDYARVFVPAGSKLVDVNGTAKSTFEVGSGQELGKTWFGVYATIEPGQTGNLSFIYDLSPSIENQIKNGTYSLIVQKQLGTGKIPLSLNLGFEKKLNFAAPSELIRYHGDTAYTYQTDLSVDRNFAVKF